MEDLGGKDPYDVLGLEATATEKEIKKAYRKGALKSHPDRNPDNPVAAAKFLLLVKAHDVLTDAKAKAAYDAVLKLKNAAKARDQKLTAEQRKIKQELEARENAYKRQKTDSSEAARRLEAEIIRLREQGQQRIVAEQDRLRAEALAGEDQQAQAVDDSGYALKVKWSTKSSKEAYNVASLTRLFQKYGSVDIRLSKKPGVALLSFSSLDDAVLAHQHERGLRSNPLKSCDWVDAPPRGHDPFAAALDFSETVADIDALEKRVLTNMGKAQRQKK